MRRHCTPAPRSLFTARLAAGRAARSTLVAHNMRLVYRMAMLFSGRGISIQDLVVAGVRGVLRSMETFETRKGCRFCTYATFWVRAMLQRLLIEGFTVRCVRGRSAGWRGRLMWRWLVAADSGGGSGGCVPWV